MFTCFIIISNWILTKKVATGWIHLKNLVLNIRMVLGYIFKRYLARAVHLLQAASIQSSSGFNTRKRFFWCLGFKYLLSWLARFGKDFDNLTLTFSALFFAPSEADNDRTYILYMRYGTAVDDFDTCKCFALYLCKNTKGNKDVVLTIIFTLKKLFRQNYSFDVR